MRAELRRGGARTLLAPQQSSVPYSHATRAVRAQSADAPPFPQHGRTYHRLVAPHDSGYRTEPGWPVAATKRGLLKAAAASRETLSAGKGSPATGALPPSPATSPRLDLAASWLSRTRSACTWVSPCGCWCRGAMTVGAAGPKLKPKGFLFGGGAPPSGCPEQVGAPAPWLAAGREAFCARTRSAASRDACARCSCSADGCWASAVGKGLRASTCAVRVPGWSNAAQSASWAGACLRLGEALHTAHSLRTKRSYLDTRALREVPPA
jgi:hypothetical protein